MARSARDMLDSGGARVWELLAAPLTPQELWDSLESDYDVSPFDCARCAAAARDASGL